MLLNIGCGPCRCLVIFDSFICSYHGVLFRGARPANYFKQPGFHIAVENTPWWCLSRKYGCTWTRPKLTMWQCSLKLMCSFAGLANWIIQYRKWQNWWFHSVFSILNAKCMKCIQLARSEIFKSSLNIARGILWHFRYFGLPLDCWRFDRLLDTHRS